MRGLSWAALAATAGLALATPAQAQLMAPAEATPPSVLGSRCPNAPMPVRTAPDGTRFVRTPAACLTGLEDFPYRLRTVTIDGLRQGYIDEGPRNGKVILMLHGQPTWSYLYRHMIRELSRRGYRTIAMDHLGFGNSDKPIELSRYSVLDHAHRLVAFIRALGLDKRDTTLFAQDWGSVIGLYVAGRNLDLFDRMVIGNGGLPQFERPFVMPTDTAASNARFRSQIGMMPAQQPYLYDDQGRPTMPMPSDGSVDYFGEWMSFAMNDESFRPSAFVEALTFRPTTAGQRLAYDAPFPSRIAMAGPRVFPSLLNQTISLTPASAEGLKTYRRPVLSLVGGNEPGADGPGDGSRWIIANIPGAQGQPHHRYRDASHYLQEDQGVDISARIDAFLRANP